LRGVQGDLGGDTKGCPKASKGYPRNRGTAKVPGAG